MTTRKFKELEGIHLLDAVEFGNYALNPRWEGDEPEIAAFMKFRLDGVTYMSREDENDGYRSSMRDFTITRTPPKYKFPPALVQVSVRTKNEWDEDEEILEVRDVLTHEIVLETGTTNLNDYYPGYVARWMPKGLAINAQLSPEVKKAGARR